MVHAGERTMCDERKRIQNMKAKVRNIVFRNVYVSNEERKELVDRMLQLSTEWKTIRTPNGSGHGLSRTGIRMVANYNGSGTWQYAIDCNANILEANESNGNFEIR
jgi:hypothetical protein